MQYRIVKNRTNRCLKVSFSYLCRMNVANISTFKLMAMIQELTIKNFLSFKEATTFSFEATNDKTLEDYQVVQIGSTRLLRFALVYGANASGKSNLLAAFEFLWHFWFSRKQAKADPIGAQPFKLDQVTPNEPSSFELVFFIGDLKYKYEVELDNKVVYRERLSYYKTIQPTLLLNRTLDKGLSVVKLHADLKVSKAALEELSLKCLPNMSFFAAKEMVNVAIPFVDEVLNWMGIVGLIDVVKPETDVFSSAARYISDSNKLKDFLLGFMQRSDFNIAEIIVKREKGLLSDEMFEILLHDKNLTDDAKQMLLDGWAPIQVNVNFKHEVITARGRETYFLPSGSQSAGTRRGFGIETEIYHACVLESFLAIDEIEASLHPELIEFILTRFLQEKGRSQLLITTHYDPLLDEVDDMYRKDMVWFTEKGEDGATKLYSLADFKGLNKISSFRKFYRNGRFGALPNIG